MKCKEWLMFVNHLDILIMSTAVCSWTLFIHVVSKDSSTGWCSLSGLTTLQFEYG